MRVGVLANVTRPGMREAVAEMEVWAARDGHQICYDEILADYSPAEGRLLAADALVGEVEMLFALGGDGTMLRAARLVGRRGVPILGVNLGSLGFLAEITPAELPTFLVRISQGDYRCEARALLALCAGGKGEQSYAVNEVTVDRGQEFRAIEIKLEADDELVCRYVADGLIMATPTGSTAYALSAGGPVTVPQLQAIVVTPVAPHTLAQRPIVFPDSVVLRVTSEEPNVEVVATVDGHKRLSLSYGDSCEVRRADFDLQLVRFPERDFYALVRSKLHWGINPRHAHRDERMV